MQNCEDVFVFPYFYVLRAARWCDRCCFEEKTGFKFEWMITKINNGQTSGHTGRRKTENHFCRQSNVTFNCLLSVQLFMLQNKYKAGG